MNTLEINESDKQYNLDNMSVNSEAWKRLWSKNLLIYDYYSRFWQPRLEMGKKCMEYMRREIFTESQRVVYKNVENKIPVEPQEMKPVINGLVKMIIDNIQSALMTTEDESPPPNACSAQDFNIVLKKLLVDLKMAKLKKKALRQGVITGYPQWIWFDLERALGEFAGDLVASLLPWDGTLSSPWFEEEDGTDIDDIVRFALRTEREALDTFPERKEDLGKFNTYKGKNQEAYYKELLQIDEKYTADDRKDLLFNIINSAWFDAMSGYYLIVERVFPIKKDMTVYVNEQTEDMQMMPETWDKNRVEKWEQANPDYNIRHNESVKLLWTSTISTDGFVWENKPHWYQEDGALPGIPYIPDLIDRIPVGAGEDMIPYILQVAVSDTEQLHDVRVNTGTLTVVREGSILHPKSLNKELSSQDGVIVVKKNVPEGTKAVDHIQRKPNDVYGDYADRIRNQLANVHSINESMLGYTHPRQSEVAKRREIQQGQGPQMPYIENYSNFNLNCSQIISEMIPYFMTEYKVITIKDEFGKEPETVEVNVPVYNMGTGTAESLANDLTAVKYRLTPTQAEDTPTSRERDLKDYVEIISAVGNTLFQINPKLLANLLVTLPNRYAKETGDYLKKFADQFEQQQAQAGQAEQEADMMKDKMKRDVDMMKIVTPRVTYKIDPKDIQEAPAGAKILFDALNKTNQLLQPTT